MEFDPVTFNVSNSITLSGILHGLAVSSIPEPSAILFLAVGLIGLAGGHRRGAS